MPPDRDLRRITRTGHHARDDSGPPKPPGAPYTPKHSHNPLAEPNGRQRGSGQRQRLVLEHFLDEDIMRPEIPEGIWAVEPGTLAAEEFAKNAPPCPRN